MVKLIKEKNKVPGKKIVEVLGGGMVRKGLSIDNGKTHDNEN